MSQIPLLSHLPNFLNTTAATFSSSGGLSVLLSKLPPSVTTASAIHEWIWLVSLMYGSLYALWQQFSVPSYVNNFITRYMYLSLEVRGQTLQHEWIMVWLSQQPSWTPTYSNSLRLPGKEFGVWAGNFAPLYPEDSPIIRRLHFDLVRSSSTYTCWFKNRFVRIHLAKDSIQIGILAFRWSILLDLLREAEKVYHEHRDDTEDLTTAVYNSFQDDYYGSARNRWVRGTESLKRSLDSIILDPNIKTLVLEDAKDFLNKEEWYTKRGIPHRRGYLLHGEPGSGKTSFITAIAGALNLNIYVISLAQTGMDDAALSTLFATLPSRCVVVIEDIDAAFTSTLNRDDHSQDHRQASGNVSLSGLLNALDGIGAKEGRILFATTNKYGSLDSALSRDGRMDIHIEFKLAAKDQIQHMFHRFYDPDDLLKTDSPEDNKDSSPKLADVDKVPSTPLPSAVTLLGSLHAASTTLAPISYRRLQELAQSFADVVPENRYSMARIQNYLIRYKVDPVAAVDGVGAWVEEHQTIQEQSGRGLKMRRSWSVEDMDE